MTQTFTVVPRGEFSLRELAEFGFGQRQAQAFEDGVMRLAFCVDGYRAQVGVEVRQDDDGVHGTVVGADDADMDVDPATVRRQVARVLSLDQDGEEFADVGRRDPVIGRLQSVAPGLRPPLFYSPYEAAAWCVLSARRAATQMAQVRQRLSEAHGQTFSLAGQSIPAFPMPEQLLAVESFPGLNEQKISRLHEVAKAALDGQLDADRLLALGPEQATAAVRRLSGIGPFYAALIVVRGTGFADVLPEAEPRLLALVTRLYDLPHPCDAADLARIGAAWAPLRTWAAVLIRAAASRLPEAAMG